MRPTTARASLLWMPLAVAATAGLVWLGTGLHPTWPALWLAPLPVLLLAPQTSGRVAAAAALTAWLAGSLNVWAYYQGVLRMPVPVAAGILLGGAGVFTLAVFLHRALLLRGAPWAAALTFPATWASCEYLISLASPHGTAGSLAYTQVDLLPVLQLAALTGPTGLTFLVMLLPGALAAALHVRAEAPDTATRLVLTTASAIAAVLLFGASRLAQPSGPTVRVALLASDGPLAEGVPPPGPETTRLLADYAAQAATLAAHGAQVIVLPEKIGVTADPNTADVDALFQPVADRTGATVVVGLVHVSMTRRQNEARVYRPAAAPTLYAKQHLLPPFESRMEPGTALTLLAAAEPSRPWGVAICKDLDFAAPARPYGQSGAGLLLVPAWDFVADRWLHGRMAVMRGVESGFAVARSARQGLLTVSDDRGRILAQRASDTAPFTTLVADVPAVHHATLYLVLGSWFSWVALALLAAGAARLLRRQRDEKG